MIPFVIVVLSIILLVFIGFAIIAGVLQLWASKEALEEKAKYKNLQAQLLRPTGTHISMRMDDELDDTWHAK